jgi:hypothetical protein
MFKKSINNQTYVLQKLNLNASKCISALQVGDGRAEDSTSLVENKYSRFNKNRTLSKSMLKCSVPDRDSRLQINL